MARFYVGADATVSVKPFGGWSNAVPFQRRLMTVHEGDRVHVVGDTWVAAPCLSSEALVLIMNMRPNGYDDVIRMRARATPKRGRAHETDRGRAG